MFDLAKTKIGIVGLGYVGLPLAVEFGKLYDSVGLDTNPHRIDELKNGVDTTLEVEPEEIKQATKILYTTNPDDLKGCNVYIVTVPTPIDNNKRPDLSPLENASRTIGKLISKND